MYLIPKPLVFHFTKMLCPHRFCLCVVPLAGAMVVGHRVSRMPQPLSAERELCRASTLSRTLVASCRGNRPGESQYLLMAHGAVLESDPHVIHILKPFQFSTMFSFSFSMISCVSNLFLASGRCWLHRKLVQHH